ncbi:MAG TPA: peroxidase-related enzyme [Longimicrobium sp.]|jgi:uncharacterized peroxidase-related enzyme
MPHIDLPEGVPGILSLFQFDPEASRALNALAQVVLRRPSTLSTGERETIAAYVSTLNGCQFCAGTHASAARHLLGDEAAHVDAVLADPASAPVSDRMRALLAVAARVQRGGRDESGAEVRAARAQGASDQEIHDAVLIAAAFCMFNRYVDGLATLVPAPAAFVGIGARLAASGYSA